MAPDYVLMQHYALTLKGPYFRDRVPIGTILTFWVPIYISRYLFSVFWVNFRNECQFSLHVFRNFDY